MKQNNSVAIIGYHDGSVGQITEWYERTTGKHISCFVIESEDFVELNLEEENKKRICKQLISLKKENLKIVQLFLLQIGLQNYWRWIYIMYFALIPITKGGKNRLI